ncbi:hypothetical protein IJH24_03625 [Candidatus Saccharibacteria bacterium]|nr:hypothetical protein [Candidatus Saccharibacteria bacterium]
MSQIQPIKVNKKITRKLSIATGLLSFVAFIVQGLGSTYGFEPVANQITQTFLLFNGAIGIFFLGDTTRKEIEEKNDEKTK